MILRPKWIAHLALVLVYQTAQPIEGHPRASSEMSPTSATTSPDTGSSTTQETVSRLIEEAYKDQLFLRPRQWSRQADDVAHNEQCCLQGTEQPQDTSKQLESSSDGMIHSRPKKSVQEPSLEVSMYRSPEILTPHGLAGPSMHRNSDEKIIFPDGRIPSSTLLQTSVLPAQSCRKNTFCENVADYPRQLVNAAIARNISLRFLESVDPMPDIEQRIDVADESLCRIREQVVYPQTAQNKENKWLFIVNQDDLKQGIRIEVCLNDGQQCNMIEGFAEGYKTSCKQKYIYRELAAVGSDGNIFKDQFRFPSSCCCHVKFTGNPTARLGESDKSVNRTRY